jgi:hypothetical protein
LPSLDAYVDDDGGDPLAWAFGALGVQDRARHLATLYLNDMADVLRDAVDPRFEFVRYAESLARQPAQLRPAGAGAGRALQPGGPHAAGADAGRRCEAPAHGGAAVACPSPARCTRPFASPDHQGRAPPHHHVLGGGFVNTELRELSEPRVFDYFDFVTLDAGERPLAGAARTPARPAFGASAWCAPSCATGRPVRYVNLAEPDVPFAEVGTPTWDGLPLDRYLSLLDMLNPMHRLWSDGRWNKLTVAHGCYWKKCSFCDVSLDYISPLRRRHRRPRWWTASRPSWPRPGRPAFTSSTRPRRPSR